MLCGVQPHQQNNLCAACMIDIPWSKNACRQCAEYIESITLDGSLLCTNCLKQSPPYSRTVCAFDYIGPIKGLMNQFKHQHNLAAGSLLTACLSKTISKAIALGQITIPQLVIPVPLHRRRLRQRGFNQAQFIATGLGQSLNLNVNSQLCHRSGHQAPQQGQSRQHRLAQMSGVFQITEAGVDGRIESIAIIDDVMTTGATAQALSKTLINAWDGPLDIQVWCVARAQPPNVWPEW